MNRSRSRPRMQQLDQRPLYFVVEENACRHRQYHMHDHRKIGIHEVTGGGIYLRDK